MDSHTIFAQLRDVLAELYPREEDARLVAHDAGLDEKLITFSPRAQTNWHNILADIQQALPPRVPLQRPPHAPTFKIAKRSLTGQSGLGVSRPGAGGAGETALG